MANKNIQIKNGSDNIYTTPPPEVENRLAIAESNIESLQVGKLNNQNPQVYGIIEDMNLTCSTKQIINGEISPDGNVVYVGNPEIDNVILQDKNTTSGGGAGLLLNQIARKTDLTSYIGKSDIKVTSTQQSETIPPGASKAFAPISQTYPGNRPLFSILTARGYGDYISINQTATYSESTATISGYIGNWHTEAVTVQLEMRTIWIKN